MGEILTVTLRRAVHGRLDYLDKLATDADLRSRAALADTEIVRLTSAWRTLLAAHQPDERGRCPECSGWRRPRRHPCSVWTTAHQHLIAPDGPPADRTGRPPRSAKPSWTESSRRSCGWLSATRRAWSRDLAAWTGRMVSVDIDAEMAGRARDLLEATGYGSRVIVVRADAADSIPGLDEPVDAILMAVGRGTWRRPGLSTCPRTAGSSLRCG